MFLMFGFFLERMRHSFLPRNSNFDVAKSVDTVSKLARGTLTSFFIHPSVLLGQDDKLEWHRISNDGQFILKSRACDPRV